MSYEEFENGRVKAWTRGVQVEDSAREQLANLAKMPYIFKHIAVMPDVHWGFGATVGSVIAMQGAVVPSAVGVDIGCGMFAARTNLVANDLPDNLFGVRSAIEAAVPHGRTSGGGPGDRGAWGDEPLDVLVAWRDLEQGFAQLTAKRPSFDKANHRNHLGTLGTGNHFIEVCLDEEDQVWVMLHSGSRGIGAAIGSHYIALAKKDMERQSVQLPDANLAYFVEGSEHFHDYCEAVSWAQSFAAANRQVMMQRALVAISQVLGRLVFATEHAVNCHHNYVSREQHFGEDVLITRKGAVRVRKGERGIIPGSMGAKSFIVKGKGNPDSYCSCSHGAGRAMSRTKARERFTVEDHALATAGVECRKDEGVLDETPAAYKDIDAVMAAQMDLVEVEHTLRQVVCVKG